MRYMLDTDICSYVIRARNRRLLATMQTQARAGAELTISAITYAELRLGAERSRSVAKHTEAVRLFCDRLSGVLAWDRAAADQYALIQASLLGTGTPIGANDAMIAAHALSRGYQLVTNNLRHFERIPELDLANWLPNRA